MTGEALYEFIMLAREDRDNGGSDRVVDIRLRTMTRKDDGRYWIRKCRKRTIGKEGGKKGFVVTCPQKLEDWMENDEIHRLVGHIMHEYMHHLGFKHPKAHKFQSAVYQVGYLVRDLAKDLYHGNCRI